MDVQQHLMELSSAAGLSGHEGPIRAILQSAWKGLSDSFEVDPLGNLIATRSGTDTAPRHRLLVTGHMDEIGLMVNRIDGAFLRVVAVGGIDRRTLLNQPVIVHGREPLRGVIGSRPPHVLTAAERRKVPPLDEIVVDTGLPERSLRRLVKIGAPISFDQQARALGDGLVTGKSLDNRASVAALTAILHALRGRACAWDVLVAATVQEEVGLFGGATAAWGSRADAAIVIDTTWAIGAGVGEDHGFPLGGGLTLVIGPNAHPKLFDMLRVQAATLEIPLKPEALPGPSGTEGWATQISREGIPTAILSIPIRNMHTPVEIVAVRDVERAARLVAEFALTLDAATPGRLALDGVE
jgi:tetrahedral aminopeptidase